MPHPGKGLLTGSPARCSPERHQDAVQIFNCRMGQIAHSFAREWAREAAHVHTLRCQNFIFVSLSCHVIDDRGLSGAAIAAVFDRGGARMDRMAFLPGVPNDDLANDRDSPHTHPHERQ